MTESGAMRSSKLLISITIIFGIALIALVGLLLLMNKLAAPDTPPPTVVSASTAFPSPTTSPIPTKPIGNIVATVNKQAITLEQWQQATRLDTVMSRLAGQPTPLAEETLDRLVNEILVLAAVPDIPRPTTVEAEGRMAALTASWQISEAELTNALNNNNLTRTDLVERMTRLIQVESALNQLAAQQINVDTWLAQSRGAAEIGLYDALPAETIAAVTPTPARLNPAKLASPPGPDAPPPSPTPPPEMPTAPYAGNLAPDFTLSGLTDDNFSLSHYRGRPVLINFWASWCPPCRTELPALQAAYTKYSDAIGFVAVDVKEDRDTVAAFVDDMSLTFPVLLDAEGQITQLYEIRGTPTTIFVAADGTVAARHVGPLDEAAIDNYLRPLLEESAPPESHSAPDFSLTAAAGDIVSLQDYRDKQNVVLVFYRGQT